MFLLEAVIDAPPLRNDHPCGVSEAAQLCGIAQRAVTILAPVDGWTVRLVKVESGSSVRILDVRPEVSAEAKRTRPDPAAVRVARELLAVRDKGVLFIEPRPLAMAEGIVMAHDLMATQDDHEHPLAAPHADDCRCNTCIGAVGSPFPSEPVRYASDELDAAEGQGRR